MRTGISKDEPSAFYSLILGLVGESGEIAEKIKKNIRNDGADLSKLDIADMKKELGDVLWYVASVADYFEIPLEDVGQANIAKLADRQKRGVIRSTGDNR